ncbi:type II toxin-antitoxin system death-on-curing family toxin [Vibrio parahaemolyticus]|uniref:type II toxin-antitoxin system death-on-curing family toxin n=1 Tax=Vibrio parahaemolyticus TaxID=670 RepID=UPI000C9C806F|nr:type II toxin-antitoxin system death-on-curing family toxin [Vibrio parahaemolyticus]PMS91963.1 type II toxin-antitoxin system death-on-curing family toxin [Vibrio parahaemolyticus]
MITLTIDDVIAIHDALLETEKGAHGYYGDDRLGGALGRVDNQVMYQGIDDIFDIASWYVEVIARGHCFVDANKRTALSAALSFFEWNDVSISEDERLGYAVESLVKREINRDDLAIIFSSLSVE